MLVYRSDDQVVDPARAIDRLRDRMAAAREFTHDEIISFFIDVGEIESAIADAVFPIADGIHPLTSALRSAALHTGHALISSWRGERGRRDRHIEQLAATLGAIPGAELPRRISLRVSEGYAFYALRPETFVAAAEQWLGDHRPGSVVCLGIRSIGCSLAAAVAAAVERHGIHAASYTVRPRGHPFDRYVILDDCLLEQLRAARDGSFLVVDEGPGLSGSTFASVAHALRRLGIPADRIVLLPSSNPDGSAFRSATARSIWNDHLRYCVSAGEAHCAIENITNDPEGVDLSAGKWRSVLCQSGAAPPVHAQHEVVKRWLPQSASMVRFAGLGRYGEAKLRRAQALAEAGLGPPPHRLDSGYLWLAFVPAQPWSDLSEALIDGIAHHCAFLTRTFPEQRSPSVDSLFEMVVTNIGEGCGADIRLPDLESYRAALDSAPCAAIDGRMLQHEWLRTTAGFIKIDALDHHRDHFYPGTQDAGWDLAAAAFEFNLDDSSRARLIDKYIAESHDRDVAWRMPFYDIAYPAFRLGYAKMAAQSLGDSADARGFSILAERSRAHLIQLLRRNESPRSQIILPNAP